MGFNDFHKGFVDQSKEQRPNVVIKKKFGVRSVEEIVESRYNYMRKDNNLSEQPKVQERVNTVDYQQNMRSQRNLRNLDK